jgi:hypothetical protein
MWAMPDDLRSLASRRDRLSSPIDIDRGGKNPSQGPFQMRGDGTRARMHEKDTPSMRGVRAASGINYDRHIASWS